MSNVVRSKPIRTSASVTGVATAIPGWLGWGSDKPGRPSQYRPLVYGDSFESFERVDGVDFIGPHAPTSVVASDLRELLRGDGDPAVRRVVVSSSYGAMMTIYSLALEQLPIEHVVLIDPPAGAESLVALKNFKATKLAKRIGKLSSWLNDDITQWFFTKAFCQGLADTDPIDVPTDEVARGGLTPEGYVERVRQDAFDGQQGFPMTRCLEQIGAMARAAEDPVYLDACQKVDEQYRVTRIICTNNNQVVDPSISDPFYRQHLPNAQRVEVGRNHCDYVQFTQDWNAVLAPLLAY